MPVSHKRVFAAWYNLQLMYCTPEIFLLHLGANHCSLFTYLAFFIQTDFYLRRTERHDLDQKNANFQNTWFVENKDVLFALYHKTHWFRASSQKQPRALQMECWPSISSCLWLSLECPAIQIPPRCSWLGTCLPSLNKRPFDPTDLVPIGPAPIDPLNHLKMNRQFHLSCLWNGICLPQINNAGEKWPYCHNQSYMVTN